MHLIILCDFFKSEYSEKSGKKLLVQARYHGALNSISVKMITLNKLLSVHFEKKNNLKMIKK